MSPKVLAAAKFVMSGLDPGLQGCEANLDCRIKPGNDGLRRRMPDSKSSREVVDP